MIKISLKIDKNRNSAFETLQFNVCKKKKKNRLKSMQHTFQNVGVD